ncbi:MAG: hypothetical protein QM771_10745 [Nitrospira sp.]
MTTRLAGFFLLLLIWPGETVLADSPLEVVLKQCQLIRITGQFSSTGAKYQTAGQCLKYPTQLLWTGQGAYDPKDGRTQEVVELKGIPPYQGRLTIHVTCSGDPWVDSKRGGLSTPDCSNLMVQAQGEPSVVEPVLNILMGEVKRTSKPLSALYRDYVPYHLDQLRAQRDIELKAEAARAEAEAAKTEAQQRKLLQSAMQPNVLRVIPTIQTPAAGSLFLSNTSVAIKLAPPQGLAVTAYLVRLERKNSQGVWTLVTNLPVSAAEATSPAGYTGWGAPGNGRDPSRMVSLPGTYRMSAQVSSPRPTGWSQPVEFLVTAPNNAVQKAPKMFGP